MNNKIVLLRVRLKLQQARADSLAKALEEFFTQDRVKGLPAIDEWARLIERAKQARSAT